MYRMNDTDELKISEMEEAEEVNNEDLIMIVQNGINKKTKAENVGIGGEATGDTLPIGATIEWHSDIIPENWLLCNGQAVSRTDYAELFNVLGTKYGTGDGSTTFNLPNLKGKVAVGKDENDTDFNELGKTGGEKEHTLTIAEIPSHNHPLILQYGSGHEKWGLMGEWSLGTENTDQINNTGGDEAHNNMQPYIVCNFIIKAKQSSGLVATVVDNLNSTSEIDALSAKQGNVLKEKIITRSTTGQEYITNEVMNEKKVYAKRIDFGALGNNEGKVTPHGLDFNSIEVCRVEGFAVNQTNGVIYPLPNFRWDSNAAIEFWIDNTNVAINSRTDRTGVKAYVTIYYTKNNETQESEE